MSTNPWLVRIVRWLVVAVFLGAWLVLLTSRQTALYPTFAPPGPELLPVPITLAVHDRRSRSERHDRRS